MIPVLFEADELLFESNGLGSLSDVIDYTVTESRNGQYELEMSYPVTGAHYDDIIEERIILALPADGVRTQPFDIYNISAPLDGVVTVRARHVSYRLAKMVVMPFAATSAKQAMAAIQRNIAGESPFTFWTDKLTTADIEVTVPTACRSLLGGQQGSVLDSFGGGEYEFDRFEVRLHENRGRDNGVTISYGKNMTDLESERDIGDVYTSIVPYWTKDRETIIGGMVIDGHAESYAHQMCVPMDLTTDFEEQPTQEQLEAAAQAYMERNATWRPSTNVEVAFLPLWQTEEYKRRVEVQHVHLCDTVTVEHQRLIGTVKAKIITAVFDGLEERYRSLEIGEARTTLAEAINKNAASVMDLATSEKKMSGAIEDAKKALSKLISESSGLYPTAQPQPDGSIVWLLHDKRELAESTIVIKIGSAGIGLSTDGGDTYPYGYTVTGKMVMDYIAANGIDCSWLNAGVINLAVLSLAGTLCGLMQGYGSTGDGQTTQGIVMFGNGKDSAGRAKPPYLIVTSAGIRHQISDTQYVYYAGGFASFQGLSITATGNISAGGTLAAGGKQAAAYTSSTDLMQFATNAMRSWLSGRQVYMGEDGSTSETWLRGNSIQATRTIQTSSDERVKKDITPLPVAYITLLDNMQPVLYRYDREADDAPPHIGYTTGDVKRALRRAGLKRADLAALGDYRTEDGQMRLSLAYEEIIPILHSKIMSMAAEIQRIKEDMQI